MFSTPSRNHPSIVIERLFSVIFILLIVAAQGMTESAESFLLIFSAEFWRDMFSQLASGRFEVLLSGAGVLLLLVIILFFAFRVWSKTFFYIDDLNLVVERKTIFKKLSRLPVAGIANINIEQNILERILGTAKVKIDINSSVTANQTDFIFVLRQVQAQDFKQALLSAKQGVSGEDIVLAQQHEQERETVISFSFIDAVRHKLLNLPAAQIISAALLLLPAFIEKFIPDEAVAEAQTALEAQPAGEGSVLAFVAFLAFAYVASFVYGVLNISNYKLERDGRNFYISCGLLKKSNFTFEHNKINAVIVKQSLLARIFGYYYVEIAVIGLGNEQKESPQLCLYTDKASADRVLATCAPDFSCKGERIGCEKPMLVSYLVCVFLITLPALACIPLFSFGFVVPIAVLVIGAVAAVLSYKNKSIAYDEDVFGYSSGVFSKKRVCIKYGDIQLARAHTNFFYKRYDVQRICVNILSSLQLTSHKTGCFKTEHYENVASRVVAAADTSDRL
ncbi:MAG: PH domain-containing protein [Clostridiales bacterium]|nr:PH domain-containing protein [Clostridiales bacterium]